MSEEFTHDHASAKPSKRGHKVVATTLALTILGTAGAVGTSQAFRARSHGPGRAELICRGGMSSLAHVLDENAPIFPGDPETSIDREDFFYQDDQGNDVFSYRIEDISLGTHTGTHLDAPSHFIEEGARSIDELDATEFVWPAYVIDVRDRMTGTEADGFALTIDDIKQYQRDNGRIQKGSLVIIRTGLGEAYGTEAYFDDAPGFSADAVQWMVDEREIKAIGSDTFGPDATSDEDYSATYTILANDGVAIPGLANLDSVSTRGDIVIAPPVRLLDGSAYQVNPLACHGR